MNEFFRIVAANWTVAEITALRRLSEHVRETRSLTRLGVVERVNAYTGSSAAARNGEGA